MAHSIQKQKMGTRSGLSPATSPVRDSYHFGVFAGLKVKFPGGSNWPSLGHRVAPWLMKTRFLDGRTYTWESDILKRKRLLLTRGRMDGFWEGG